eukprot:Gregarina_sp_Poly_1__2615@NODE_170_length_12067_cov_151_813333_g151_i0_p4_GENE_NODE_170_length_12067_cov_151_813333_g151_i0NODE_170_length_12067_cov_151_813333_g151_i0_p4_ORF_typecomplete_len336_score30_55SRCR/PF00530_18/1_7e09LCCL/PF03815_19/3_8e09_NODE_170_length_12067_cov_151_813333_g151_i01105412061
MVMIGVDGRRTKGISLLSGSETPGLLNQIVLKAADVGVLRAIKLRNYIDSRPWTFKLITIQTQDGQIAKFQGGQWIGKPFASELEFVNLDIQEDGGLDETRSTVVDCHTRLVDMVVGSNPKAQRMKISCPQGCDSSPLAFVAGLGLHPASSSICSSAFVDGTLSASGGEISVFMQSGLQLSSEPLLLNVSDIKIYPYRIDIASSEFAFYTLSTDSIDDIVTAVRIVDAFGQLSHTGRLEIRRNNVWGTICTYGQSSLFNREAAKLACRELGYLWGEPAEDPCTHAYGYNICGAKSLPVHVGGVVCQGVNCSTQLFSLIFYFLSFLIFSAFFVFLK